MADSISHRWIFRSLAIWFVLIVAEIVHGVLRAIFLVPLVGEFRSNQIGVFGGSAIILLIAYFAVDWIGARNSTELLMVGSIWLVLTVAFEILFGRFVMSLTWDRIFSDYNMAQGGLMPIGLIVLILSPMIAARLRRRT